MSTHGYYYNHSSPNYYYGNHQQRGYNLGSVNYSSFGSSGYYTAAEHHENFAPQFWDQYQTPVFQPPMPWYYSVDTVLPQVVNSPYGPIWIHPVPHYEQIDDVYVVDELMETSGRLGNINYMTSQERNSNIDFHTLHRIVSSLLDDMYDYGTHEDDVLKYLKIRTHHAPAKDGADPDEESEICVICQSEYEDKENIGVLQCGHEYHVSCIKNWLLKKKHCPMCRTSVLPSQK